MTGGASALTIVVLSSYISAPSHRSTVVYPASASFGMLTRDVCMPGTMFISCAPSRRSCFNLIYLVAVAVRQSGNMKVFVDLSPVSSNSSVSSSGPAPEVAPESNIPVFLVFLFAIFRAPWRRYLVEVAIACLRRQDHFNVGWFLLVLVLLLCFD